jgi:hypothetical protein
MAFITMHAHLRRVVHENLWRLMSRQGVEGPSRLGFQRWAFDVGPSKLGSRNWSLWHFGLIKAPEFEERAYSSSSDGVE